MIGCLHFSSAFVHVADTTLQACCCRSRIRALVSIRHGC
jgi:hypothetical protein